MNGPMGDNNLGIACNLPPADPSKLLEKAEVLDWILKESELGSC